MNTIRVVRTEGRYNLASTEREVQFGVRMPDGTYITEFCEPGAKWDVDLDDNPFDVLEKVEARLRSYLFSSRRDETLARIDAARANRAALERDWLAQRVRDAEQRVKRAQEHLAQMQAEYVASLDEQVA